MKGKQLAVVLVVLAVIGGVALFLQQRNAASWSSSSVKATGKILDFPLNDVSQITIKASSAELNLAKKDGVWKVKERADYPANFDLISSLLRKIWELRAVQDVKIGPSQFGRLQLLDPGSDPNSGTLLDLKGDGGKRIAALLIGKKYLKQSDGSSFAPPEGMPSGRYARTVDSANRVVLVADTLDEVDPKPEKWLSRDFIKVENAKTITLAGATPPMNWKLTRDTATSPWKLADAKPGEELDVTKASAIAALFSYAPVADVMAPDAPVAETGLDKPAVITIETFDGFVYTLKIGKPVGENYPVLVSVAATLPKERTPGKDEKPEDKAKLDQEFQIKQTQLTEKLAKEQKLEPRPYLIAKGTVEQLLKERSGLLAAKTPTPTPAVGTPTPAPTQKQRK
ncbi:MAG TPA: DUF4340 domain-containing protein [Chthoniobacterales bacterium]|nr:DUF4340 domain-containing protein [Chthoniobacterales bacterium]